MQKNLSLDNVRKTNDLKRLGNHGEFVVTRYLQEEGFSIVARNFFTKHGEIDIIARKKNLIAFVEVKTRSHSYFSLSQVITYTKQKSIIKTAEYYIAKNKLFDFILRFDVALLLAHANEEHITYIPNAFTKAEEQS